jgi:hypothetical protein
MSIQFRSRIKPAIDYSTILNSYGVCCDENKNKTYKSFYECFTEGGHFIPGGTGSIDTVSCPDRDEEVGCCCACKYVTDTDYDLMETYPPTNPYLSSGTRNNISKCECNRLGGKWSNGPCEDLTEDNWSRYCVKNDIDVRYPKSCCHLYFDESTGWPVGIKCEDVCSSYDCALLGTETYPSYFDSEKRCTIPLRPGDDVTQCASSDYFPLVATRSLLYKNFSMGSCYTLEDNDGTLEYNCTLTPQVLCDGYWVAEQDENNAYCTSSFQPQNPQKVSNKYQVQSITQANFDALGLCAGDQFQGGVFIGVFEPTPNNPQSSYIFTNINFSSSSKTRFYGDSVGGSSKKWAIIVDETRYSMPFLNEQEADLHYNTSLWDGYYNTYGNGNNFDGIKTTLTNTLRDVPRKGFMDWYIPSIYELGFYSLYLLEKQKNQPGFVFSSSYFDTSKINAPVTKTKLIDNNSFVYGQNLYNYNDNYYYTYRVGLIDKRSTQTALFFRRIVIE